MSITSTGMSGFSEGGPPEGWDWTVGSVTGYRWFNWYVPPKLAGWLNQGTDNAKKFSNLIGAYSGEWRAGKIEAECKSNIYRTVSGSIKHEPPEYRESCGCGFWAYWDENIPASGVITIDSHAKIEQPPLFGGSISCVTVPVVGVVRGSGRTIIGEKGFRSQYGEIIALCLPEEADSAFTQWRWKTDLPIPLDPQGKPYTETEQFEARMRRGNYFTDIDCKEASFDEATFRRTQAEAVLGDIYPGARIFTSRDNMNKYFPPDKVYGKGSAFQLDIEYGNSPDA